MEATSLPEHSLHALLVPLSLPRVSSERSQLVPSTFPAEVAAAGTGFRPWERDGLQSTWPWRRVLLNKLLSLIVGRALLADSWMMPVLTHQPFGPFAGASAKWDVPEQLDVRKMSGRIGLNSVVLNRSGTTPSPREVSPNAYQELVICN